jgi:UDP-3-O-[3-hydroxymyristoyl] glucosamine N-acyltransferase
MATTLAKLAELVGGTVLGDPEMVVGGAAPVQDAGPNDITLIDRPENAKQLAGCVATAVVVPRNFTADDRATIAVDDVHAAFIEILLHFRPGRAAPPVAIHPSATINPTALIDDGVNIGPAATIGDNVHIAAGTTVHAGAHIMAGCRIGRDVTIFPNAVLHEDTLVGDRTIIHACAVIGAHGFGYRMENGRHQLSAQLGYVEIQSDVEVGACTTIDRGTYGRTLIGEGTKIDNQVMIAHNCQIGKHNMLCSQVGIAGSTSTGVYVVMAGQVGVRDHVHIGARSVLGAKAGISNDVPEGITVFGIPATPERKQKLLQASLSKLPEMRKQLRALQRKVEEMAKSEEQSDDRAAA